MRYLFVGGSQRSGTSLLQKLLCQSPDATPYLAEASYLRLLMQAYAEAKADFENDTMDYFDDLTDLRQFHAGVVDAFLARTLARARRGRSLVLKEPHLTQHFPHLFELAGESRFVLIMRDPRDIMASMISVGERFEQQGQTHFFQQRNIGQLARLIKSFYAPSLYCEDDAFRQRMLTIRYEDLVERTDRLKQRLSEFTGLKFDHREYHIDVSQTGGNRGRPRYAPWFTENSGKDINASSVGRYREILSSDEIAQARHHCSDLIEMFQYH